MPHRPDSTPRRVSSETTAARHPDGSKHFLGDDPGASLLDIANLLLAEWRSVVWPPVVLVVLVILVSLLTPRMFTATAVFGPQTDGERSTALGGIAAQLGLQLPSAEESATSPQFYVELLESREILEATARSKYAAGTSDDPESGFTLIDLYGVKGSTPGVRLERAIDRLEKDLSVRHRRAGLVELSVRARRPVLAQQLVARMLELVNDFNVEKRQSQAASERQFVEARLRHAELALLAAEDSLQTFLQQNRRYETSPELRFEHDRLQRRVDLRQQSYVSLNDAYERAVIAEVRNTPVITVLDPPHLPVRPDSSRLVPRSGLALLLGLAFGIGVAFTRQSIRSAREGGRPDYARFLELRTRAVDRLPARLRRLGRSAAPDVSEGGRDS